MRTRLAVLAVLLTTASAFADAAPAQPVVVYLDRHGARVPADDDTPAAVIPPFGGPDHVWRETRACVAHDFAPFRITVVDRKPAQGPYITVLVGGLASAVGMDDNETNGVGPYTGELEPDATVFVFSQVGTGETDVENLCSVAAHEVGHALGLDHSFLCGDLMSYYNDTCGERTFRDVDAACGESTVRACDTGAATQNSYRQIAAAVGLRPGITLAAAPQLAAPNPPFPTDDDGADAPAVPDGASVSVNSRAKLAPR